jgi:hypothetical protein
MCLYLLYDLYMFLFFEGDELIYFFLAMLEDMQQLMDPNFNVPFYW